MRKANKNCFRLAKRKVEMAKWRTLIRFSYSDAHVNGLFRWGIRMILRASHLEWLACRQKLYIYIYEYATPSMRIYLSRKNVLTLMVVAPTKYDRLKSNAGFASMLVYHMTIYNDSHSMAVIHIIRS